MGLAEATLALVSKRWARARPPSQWFPKMAQVLFRKLPIFCERAAAWRRIQSGTAENRERNKQPSFSRRPRALVRKL